ncbi:unnamed protein product [Choristocarpus tenellus]
MSRYAYEFDNDYDQGAVPDTRPPSAIVAAGQGKKRARELSKLKESLERVSEKERQSWDHLKRAVSGEGVAGEKGKFAAAGSSRAVEHIRAKTVGLVTAEDFRKTREAADAMEEAEKVNREREEESKRKKEEKRKRKKKDKETQLRKSKMSFDSDDEGETGGSDTTGSREGIRGVSNNVVPQSTPCSDNANGDCNEFETKNQDVTSALPQPTSSNEDNWGWRYGVCVQLWSQYFASCCSESSWECYARPLNNFSTSWTLGVCRNLSALLGETSGKNGLLHNVVI